MVNNISPDKKDGSGAGRKQRQRDQKAGTYPRPGLPISRKNKSPAYVKAWRSAYYQPQLGNKDLGDDPVMVPVDRDLYEQVTDTGHNVRDVLARALAYAVPLPPYRHRLLATISGGRVAFSFACGPQNNDRAILVQHDEDWDLVTCPCCLATRPIPAYDPADLIVYLTP